MKKSTRAALIRFAGCLGILPLIHCWGLAQAQVVNPLVTPEFPLDQAVNGPAPATRSSPVVAANGSGHLVAWCQGKTDAADPGVYAARLDPSGRLLDPLAIRVSPLAAEQSVCAVAAIEGLFLVVWAAPHGTSTTDWDILGARVLPDGSVLDSALPICTLATSVQATPAIAANGGDFMVAWRDSRNTSIYGTLVGADGNIASTNGIMLLNGSNEQFTPAVAALGTNFLVVAQDYRRSTASAYHSDIFGARVSGTGRLLDTNSFAICTNSGSQFKPAVAADGTNYLVVWQDYDIAGGDILGARVTEQGVVLDPGGTAISHAANLQANPSVAASAQGFLVTWQDYRTSSGGDFTARTRLARVSGAGIVIDVEGVELSAAEGGQHRPRVAVRGEDWLTVWEDLRDNPRTVLSDVWSAMGAASNAAVTAEALVSFSSNAQLSPSVANLGSHYLAVWADNRNATNAWDICGVRLDQDGAILDARPLWICTDPEKQSDPVVAAGSNSFLVAWTDWRNTPATMRHGDIYGALIAADGTMLTPGGIPLCTATNDQSLPVITYVGTNFLVVWQDARSNQTTTARMDIFATRVTESGQVLDPAGIPLCLHPAIQTNPAVAACSGQALVVWTDHRASLTLPDIFGARVGADGIVVETNGFPICTTLSSAQNQPSVASDGANFFVVWADFRSLGANPPDLYGTFVDETGRVVWTNGVVLRGGLGPQTAPATAFNGLDYFVTWQSASNNLTPFDIHAVQMDPAAPWASSAGLLVATNSYNQTAGAVAAGHDGRFLVLYQTSTGSAPRIMGVLVNSEAVPRLDPAGLSASGQFELRFRGATGQRYEIQSTTDFQTWTVMRSFTNDSPASVVLDPEPATAAPRFYRAVWIP